jgi:hypothetical protein
MNIKLTSYGQKALNSALLNGQKPVIKKGAYSINLNKLDRVSDATIKAFMAPDNFNPYFEVTTKAPAAAKTSAKS